MLRNKAAFFRALVFASAMLVSSGLACSGDWWDIGWEYRVGVSLQNDSRVDLTDQPVVICGGEFMEVAGINDMLSRLSEKFNWPENWSRLEGVRVSSLRLVSGGELIPVQVDRIDASGRYRWRTGDVLTSEDEIVFITDIPAGKEVALQIYFSLQSREEEEYQSDIRVYNIDHSDLGTIQLAHSWLSLVVKGPRSNPDVEPDRTVFSNFGCGSITDLRILGNNMVVPFLHPRSNFGQVIPSGGRSLPFSRPQLTVDGPVRKIIGMEKISPAGDDVPARREYRYFAVYSNSGRVDFTNVFDYETRPSYNPRYAGGIFDRDNALIVPGNRVAEIIDFVEKELQGEGTQLYYRTSEPEQGFFAWLNREYDIGLATFFDAQEFSVSLQHRNPLRSLGQRWGGVDNRLSTRADGKLFKLTFFAVRDTQEVLPIYEFWKNPGIVLGIVESGGF